MANMPTQAARPTGDSKRFACVTPGRSKASSNRSIKRLAEHESLLRLCRRDYFGLRNR